MQAIARVAATLKPGTARVLVRDYAEGDLAQQRFQRSARMQRISHNFYARSDGTCAYFFSQVSPGGASQGCGTSESPLCCKPEAGSATQTGHHKSCAPLQLSFPGGDIQES